MITKFNIFEARFSDEMRIKNPNDILRNYKEKHFEVERKFPVWITTRKKKRYHIIWNQSEEHNIYNKIEDRKISVKSIDELTDKLRLVLDEITQLIENKEIYMSGKYGIILTQSRFCIVFFIDLKKYLNKEYEIQIKTIMPMSALADVIREIKLDI